MGSKPLRGSRKGPGRGRCRQRRGEGAWIPVGPRGADQAHRHPIMPRPFGLTLASRTTGLPRAPARASASEVMAVTCLRSEETAQSSQWAMPYIMRSARWADVRCLRLFTTVRSSVSRHAERAWSSMRCSRPFQGSRSLRQSPQRGRGARGSHRWRQRCCCSCWQRRSRRWRTPART